MIKITENWVRNHYINGPSPLPFKNIKRNEVQLAYNIEKDKYILISKHANFEELKFEYYIFYVVFREELNEHLHR
jgi:hypothetical protein